MKPLITKREMADALDLVRRAYKTLDWLKQEGHVEVPCDPDSDAAIQAWADWLGRHGKTLPGDVVPPPGNERLYAFLLATCSQPPATEKAKLSHREVIWLCDWMLSPLRFLAREEQKRQPTLNQVEVLAGSHSQRSDDACLFTFAWECAFHAKTNQASSAVRGLWRLKAHAMVERLTIAEVWLARKRLLEWMRS